MKKLIFGGICFLGGLLLMLVDPSFDYGGSMDFIVNATILILTIFGFVLSIIGFIKKDNNGSK